MKIGMNTLLFTAYFKDEHTKLFKKIKDIGFDGVEIALAAKGDFDYKRTADAMRKQGLECAAICGMFGTDRDIRGPNKAYIKNGIQYSRDLIDCAKALGCEIAAGPSYSAVGRANMETPEDRKVQWKTVVQNLKEICKYAEDQGIYVALEPLNRFETDFMNICGDAIRMIKEVGSPMLKVHLDTFHMNIEEKDSVQAILDAGDLLYHFHTSENDRGTPGTGQVPWKGIAKALKKIKYKRWVCIESFTPDNKIIAKAASVWRQTEKNEISLAEKGFKFLKELLPN
ncbi:MAG: sugar phosphate isomerase/epimerase [Spirochaetales bacterium]|nr:MAG: sugar phosphate isomerase/epimerase [Spirochaetales bacterium]